MRHRHDGESDSEYLANLATEYRRGDRARFGFLLVLIALAFAISGIAKMCGAGS